MKTKNHFSDAVVEHSFGCSSVSCLLSKTEHTSIVHFDTKTDSFMARTLDQAARMWIDNGAKELIDVGRIG